MADVRVGMVGVKNVLPISCRSAPHKVTKLSPRTRQTHYLCWWDNDPGSFMFSVVNPRGDGPLILRSIVDGESSKSVCVFYNPQNGPMFGNGYGFYIQGKSFQTCFTDHRSLAYFDTGETGSDGHPVLSTLQTLYSAAVESVAVLVLCKNLKTLKTACKQYTAAYLRFLQFLINT